MGLFFKIQLLESFRIIFFLQILRYKRIHALMQPLSPELANFLITLILVFGILDFTLIPFFLIFIRKLYQQRLKKKAKEAGRIILFKRNKIVTVFDGVIVGASDDITGCCCGTIFLIILIPLIFLSFIALSFGLLHIMAIVFVVVIPALLIIATIYDLRNQKRTLKAVLAGPLPEPIRCAACGTTLSFDDRFCTNCGETIRKETEEV